MLGPPVLALQLIGRQRSGSCQVNEAVSCMPGGWMMERLAS